MKNSGNVKTKAKTSTQSSLIVMFIVCIFAYFRLIINFKQKNTIVILHRLNQQGQHAHAPNGNNDAGNILEQKHSKAVQQSTSATKSHITRRNQYKACPWMHGFNAGLGRTNPKRTT